jgi:peroxiredoxin
MARQWKGRRAGTITLLVSNTKGSRVQDREVTMRLTVGTTAPAFEAATIDGRRCSLGALRGRTVLLKFYRFATCPVCNLHMRYFVDEYKALEALGLTTVVLFHSPETKLTAAQRDRVPFDLVADPAKRIFSAYGVEQSWTGMLSPSVALAYAAALWNGFPAGLLTSDGGITGNPADFMIDADGRIAYAHYGRHYADSLTVPQIAAIRRELEGEVRVPAFA